MEEPLEISIQGVATSLRIHGKPGLVGFMLYDLLNEAGYDDEEIRDVATSMIDSSEED
jgi:hypothetical protein